MLFVAIDTEGEVEQGWLESGRRLPARHDWYQGASATASPSRSSLEVVLFGRIKDVCRPTVHDQMRS